MVVCNVDQVYTYISLEIVEVTEVTLTEVVNSQ